MGLSQRWKWFVDFATRLDHVSQVVVYRNTVFCHYEGLEWAMICTNSKQPAMLYLLDT